MTESRFMVTFSGVGVERQITKGHEKSFMGDRYIYYLNYGQCLMLICQNLSNFTFILYTVFVIYSSIKL